MAKYLNSSSLPFTVNGLTYEPWIRPTMQSDVSIRRKNRPVPMGLKTCWELNTVSGANLTWSRSIPPCGACHTFHQDKDHRPQLRKLPNNHSAPYRYRCDTLWKASSKRVAPTASMPAPTSISEDSPPSKKQKANSIPTSPEAPCTPEAVPTILEAMSIVRRLDVTPSPASVRRLLLVDHGCTLDDSLLTYLMHRISRQDALIEDFEGEKKNLKEQNDFYNATQVELNLLVDKVRQQSLEKECEVT